MNTSPPSSMTYGELMSEVASLRQLNNNLTGELRREKFDSQSLSRSQSEHIRMLASENRALREAARYALTNLDAAAEKRVITCPQHFQVQLDESRKLLRAALGNKATA